MIGQHEDVEQGSETWKLLRVGRVTASRVADIIAKTKSGPASSRPNYLAELVIERLTGIPAPAYVSAAMQNGTEQEPTARAAYSLYRDVEVQQVGFIHHPNIAMSGASPDGLILDKGTVEIKVPLTATHLEALLGKSVPGRYLTQIQWGMACSGREWCDYVSYNNELPDPMRLFIYRVERDAAMILELESQVRAFLAELDTKVKALTAIYGGKPAIAA